MQKTGGNLRWWGSIDLPSGRTARWRIGSLRLSILNSENEWRIAHEHRDESADDTDWSFDIEASFPDEPGNLERYVFRQASDAVRILPVMGDRPVVTSPVVPTFLLPDEEATLYVGSPLWIRIEAQQPPRFLREVPIRRLSDTWFGPSTREGELCYATRTRAVQDIDALPLLPRRAVTPVLIRNRAPEALTVERLKLPVTVLPVYAASSGRLWTSSLTMTRDEENEMADVQVRPGPPAEAPEAELVGPPRAEPEKHQLIHAFSALFR